MRSSGLCAGVGDNAYDGEQRKQSLILNMAAAIVGADL